MKVLRAIGTNWLHGRAVKSLPGGWSGSDEPYRLDRDACGKVTFGKGFQRLGFGQVQRNSQLSLNTAVKLSCASVTSSTMNVWYWGGARSSTKEQQAEVARLVMPAGATERRSEGLLTMVPIPHVKFAIGALAKKLLEPGDQFSVTREVLARLLDLYISCWDFDEEWYLWTYPDIQDAIAEGRFLSGWAHFRTVGYFEGRLGAKPSVDPEWYIGAYPDIAQAMLAGEVTNVLDHYVQFGYAEGRLPREPAVHPKWYAPRYLPTASGYDREVDCTNHFIHEGYRKLAVPAPPR